MAVIRQVAVYFSQYGVTRGLRRMLAKLRSPVFRPLLLESLKRRIISWLGEAARRPETRITPLAWEDCEQLLHATDVLVLDNTIGGGATSFRKQFQQDMESGGKAVLVLFYDQHKRVYAVRKTLDGNEFSLETEDRAALIRLIENNFSGMIFVNNIVSWPEPVALLGWLQALTRRMPLQAYLHDYFFLCPTIVLLDATFRFCGLPEDPEVCSRCLRGNLFAAPYTPTSMNEWRTAWRDFLHACSVVWAPHESVRELAGRVYPHLASGIPIYPGAALESLHPELGYSPHKPFLPTTIAVVGRMDIHKGGLIVAELVQLLRQSGAAERLVVIGEMTSPFRKGTVEATGAYEREALPGMLAKHAATVCLVPSVWPETFCYVVDELINLGMPIVCFDIGAQGAKIKKYRHGAIVPAINAAACLDTIREIEKRRTGGHDHSEFRKCGDCYPQLQ